MVQGKKTYNNMCDWLGGYRMGENKMMMSSSSLSKYVVLWMERQVFTRIFVRLGKKCYICRDKLCVSLICSIL